MGQSVATWRRWAWLTGLLVIPLVILAVLVNLTGDISWIQRASSALILMIIVVGLHTFSGNSGVISFASVAFAMIAALVIATFFQLPLWLGVIGHEGSTVLVVVNGLRILWEKLPDFSAGNAASR